MSNEFSGMYEQPGSGVRYGNNKIEYVFKGLKGSGPAVMETLRQWAITDTRFRGLYVDYASCKLSPDGRFDTVFVAVDTTPNRVGLNRNRANGETVWRMNAAYEGRVLELIPGYRTNWNYDLYWACEDTEEARRNPAVTSAPAWWLTAKDTNLSAIDQMTYQWAQSRPPDMIRIISGNQKKYCWLLLLQRTRPGREAYPMVIPSVTGKTYFRTESAAIANLKLANTHVTPGVTGPYSKDPSHWVIQPDGYEEDENGYWVTTNHFLYADKWDDYYDGQSEA